jgi:hypothetical protein
MRDMTKIIGMWKHSNGIYSSTVEKNGRFIYLIKDGEKRLVFNDIKERHEYLREHCTDKKCKQIRIRSRART